MKIGGTRFKFLSKLPDAPPSPSGSNTTSPTCSPNTSTSSLPISPKTTNNNNNNNNNNENKQKSSKSSINLVYSENQPTLNREISTLMESSPSSSSTSSSASSSTVSSPTNSSIKIIASQSKSSSSLLKKQKWESDTPEDIYQLLAEQKLTEQMIWCGHPDLFPIIHQYSDILNAKENPNGSNILSINLPVSNGEFGDVKKKSYKIAKKLTVAQTINLICKKQNVKEPRKYWLSTLYGCILNDEMLLSSYGFGTFFDSWELSLVLKQVFTDKIQTDIPLDSCYGEFVVDFLLPPLKQFGGLKKKRIKVDSNLSISQILKQICTKYKIEGSERFSIITTEEFPLILNENSTLGHYGLGNKFQTLELSIVFTELIPPYSLKNNNVPTFGAFQVGSVDPVQSKAVIIDLENKLQDHLKLGEEMVLQIKNLASHLKDKEREIKDKEAQHFTIMNHIEEKLTKIRQNVTTEREAHLKQISDMKLEKESLQDSIKQLKKQLEDLNSLLYQERAINTESTIANNFKISTLEQDIQQLNDQNNDLSITLKDTENQLELTIIQKQQESQQQENEKFDLIQKYELIIKNLQRENEDKIKSILEKHQEEYNQQEKEQQEITDRLFNSLENNNNNNNKFNELIISSSSSNNNNLDIGFSSIEREQLLSSIQRLTRDINDRDVVIKQVYPKKIQNLESNIKKLEEKLKESENINQQSKQTIALKSLEITELNRQIYSLSKNNSDIQSSLDHTNELLKKEETKSRNLSQDLSNLKNQCDSQLLLIEQKSQTIQQMEIARIELEAKFKERETYLLFEIEELKKPKPPPLPTYKVNTPKSPDTAKHGDITDVKKLLKPVPNLPPPPREHTIATVADLLFVSMQKRFQSIQGPDIEDLDDDEDSGGEFI
ncbi:hypothetical protein ACTFIZ_010139 [Dictyostelium cf. discoideum]